MNEILGKNNCKNNNVVLFLMQSIKSTTFATSKIMKPYKFRFEDSREATKYNKNILKHCKYDFEEALKKEEGTMLQPGSEFRDSTLRAPIFQYHKHWNGMKELTASGFTYHLTDISEEER